MDEKLNQLTIGELLFIIGGVMSFYAFCKAIVVPFVNKWLKIDRNSTDITILKTLPARVELLEQKVAKDYERITAINEVNELMMKALQALLRNGRTKNDVDRLKQAEDEIDNFLVRRANS